MEKFHFSYPSLHKFVVLGTMEKFVFSYPALHKIVVPCTMEKYVIPYSITIWNYRTLHYHKLVFSIPCSITNRFSPQCTVGENQFVIVHSTIISGSVGYHKNVQVQGITLFSIGRGTTLDFSPTIHYTNLSYPYLWRNYFSPTVGYTNFSIPTTRRISDFSIGWGITYMSYPPLSQIPFLVLLPMEKFVYPIVSQI